MTSLFDGKKIKYVPYIYINQTRYDQAATTQDILDVVSVAAAATS